MEQAILERATLAVRAPVHPNDFDLRRIQRSLATRRRYRYVSPHVEKAEGGYRIESPCCSRNIDPEGGIIDVALMQYDSASDVWRLYRKDHARGTWEFDSAYERLVELLEQLNADPDRRFWQ